MEIVIDSHIDCADAMTAYNRSHLHTTNGTFGCSGVVRKSTVPLSKGAKAGIGIAVALPTLLVIIYFLRKWIDKRKKAEREKNAPTGVELEGRNGVEGGEQFQSVWHFAFDVYLQAENLPIGQQQAARNPTKTINQLNASILSTATQCLQYEPPN